MRRLGPALWVLAAIGVSLAAQFALVRRCEAKGMEARWMGRSVHCVERKP